MQVTTPYSVTIRSTSASGLVIPAAVTGRQPARVHTRSPGVTSSMGTCPRAVVTSSPAATHQAPSKAYPRRLSGRSAEKARMTDPLVSTMNVLPPDLL